MVLAVAAILFWPGRLTDSSPSAAFMPHAYCMWNPALIRLHMISDVLIGISYLTISTLLIYLVRQTREEMPFGWMFLAFGIFIVACGMTHFVEVITLWYPLYWLSGGVKLVTAIASVGTAALLPSIIPRIVALVKTARTAKDQSIELRDRFLLIERERGARTAAEEALHISEDRYRDLVESSRDIICTHDLTGKSSRAIRRWSGCSERRMRRRSSTAL